MVQADLGQQALKAQARGHALAALALILINHDHPFGRPAPGDGALHQAILPCRGLHVLGDLLRVGLAYIHHGLSPQMMVVEFRPETTYPAWSESLLSH